MNQLILVFFLLIFSNLSATEVDNFTHRYDDLPDQIERLNSLTSKQFSLAISKANRSS